MADRPNELGDTDLEEALIDLGKEMPYPLTPDLAAPVREMNRYIRDHGLREALRAFQAGDLL